MKCNLCGKETNNKNNLCDECNKKHEEYLNKKQENINKKDDLNVTYDINDKATISNDNKEKVEVLKDKRKEDKNSFSLAEKIIIIEIVLCIGTLFCAYVLDLIDGIIGVSDVIKDIMLVLVSSFTMASMSILCPILPGISILLGLKGKNIKNFIRILIINLIIWIINVMIFSYSFSFLFKPW